MGVARDKLRLGAYYFCIDVGWAVIRIVGPIEQRVRLAGHTMRWIARWEEHVQLSVRRGGLEPALQPVTDPGFGNQEARVIGIGFDLLPQLPHENSQILNVLMLIPGPDLLEQLIVRHHQADMHRKDMQQAILLARQPNQVLVQRNRPRCQIDRQRSCDDDGIFCCSLEIAA